MCTLTHATRRSQSDWSRSTLHEFEYVLVHITRRTLYTSTHNWTTHHSPQRSAKCQPVSLSSCLTSALTHVSRFTPSHSTLSGTLSRARAPVSVIIRHMLHSHVCFFTVHLHCSPSANRHRTETARNYNVIILAVHRTAQAIALPSHGRRRGIAHCVAAHTVTYRRRA